MPETLQCVEDIIRADRRVITDAVAIGCSHGQAYKMMHEGLGFHKVCYRWVMMRIERAVCTWFKTATTRILRGRFPGTCETVGQ
ncbi:hypothetical protein J437_LFUL019646, partial [Ladona fulva]